jgi:hypothetical protein
MRAMRLLPLFLITLAACKSRKSPAARRAASSGGHDDTTTKAHDAVSRADFTASRCA